MTEVVSKNSKAISSENTISTSQVESSSRRRRFLAYFFDSIIVSIIIQGLPAIIPVSLIPINLSGVNYSSFIAISISFLYFSMFPVYSWWGTPGQRLMGIYLCKYKDFGQLSFLRSATRVLLFNLLWIVSFAVASLFVVGSNTNNLKTVLRNGVEHKKSVHFNGEMFYNDNIGMISFQDNKSKQKIHLFTTIGKSSIIIENTKHQLSLSHDGKQMSEQYYDHNVSFNTEIQKSKQNITKKDVTPVIEHLFVLFIKIMAYATIIFCVLLVVPTFFNERKQTIYDLICSVFVARGKK